MTVRDQNIQGQDPKNSVFAKSEAIIYAAEGPISGNYTRQSNLVANQIDAMLGMNGGGLRGRHVLDVGCGYGTTMLALTRVGPPASITSIDAAEGQIDLMLAIFGGVDLVAFLEERGGKDLLGDFYDDTLAYLQGMRREYENGMFHREGGRLNMRVQSVLTVVNANFGLFDAVVANNVLHWPINAQRRQYAGGKKPEEARDAAVVDTLGPLASSLRPGGSMAILEPKDFVQDDLDPKRDRDCAEHAPMNHPIYVRLHSIINRILLETHHIKRDVPGANILFKTSTLSRDFQRSGLILDRVLHAEGTWLSRLDDALLVRMPMWLGGVDLPIRTKLEIVREAKATLRKEAPASEFALPIRSQEFVFLAHKPA